MEICQSQAARTVAGPEDSVLHRPYPACRGGRQNLDFRHMPVVNVYPALKPGRYEIDGIFQPDRLALGSGKEQSGVFGEKIREPGPVLCIDITEITRLKCLYFQSSAERRERKECVSRGICGCER